MRKAWGVDRVASRDGGMIADEAGGAILRWDVREEEERSLSIRGEI